MGSAASTVPCSPWRAAPTHVHGVPASQPPPPCTPTACPEVLGFVHTLALALSFVTDAGQRQPQGNTAQSSAGDAGEGAMGPTGMELPRPWGAARLCCSSVFGAVIWVRAAALVCFFFSQQMLLPCCCSPAMHRDKQTCMQADMHTHVCVCPPCSQTCVRCPPPRAAAQPPPSPPLQSIALH